ncbi:MAG: ribosome small subunit-dependent GTPase A, partial [Oscillospiraceae bacterium]
ELELCFREFAPFLGKCRFTGCSHTREKDCAVLAALEAGAIAPSRHKSYLSMLEEARALKDWEAL